MSRSASLTESNGSKSTPRFTTTATIKCEAYPADDDSPPPSPPSSSPPSVSVGKRWQNNISNNINNNISYGKNISNGHGSKASFTSLNGASFGAAVKKTGSVEDRWKPNSMSASRDYSSLGGQGAQNGLQETGRPSRISLAAMGSKNNNYSGSSGGPRNGANGLGGPAPPPPPPPAPPMPSYGVSNGTSAGFPGRSVSKTNLPNKTASTAPSFASSTNSLPRGFNSRAFNHNSVPRGYTPSSGNNSVGSNVSKGLPFAPPSSTPLPTGSSSTLPRGFNSSAITNGGPKFSGGSTIPSSSGLPNTLRRAESADPSSSAGKPKADPNDPQVRKLVYNMYRGLLDKKHDHSNTIISNLPQLQVDKDEGVKNRVLCMMKQQEELKSGKVSTMNGPAGPPPPPPPPPFIVAGATPPVMPEPIQVARPAPRSAPVMPLVAPPAALAGAMMKDKKPFTYTPGGLDLSEIRSPRMQRRLSRNAALEGVRPSPLAQPSSTGSPTPGSPSPSVQSGLAVQVLPMPGMMMSKTTPATPPPSQPKEPVVKKNVCGPPPPPPPFAIGSLDFKPSTPETKPVSSGPKPAPSPPIQSYVPSEPVLTTPSSPPFSSPPSDPRSPSLSLASTNSNDSGTNIPAPPPPPPQSGAARRASIVKNGFNGDSTPSTPVAVAPPSLNQPIGPQLQMATKGAETSELKTNNAETAVSSNISPNSFGESDTSRSRESSSMAVEDSSTSFREESATPSAISNVDRPEEDREHYNSNESLLKQISALEQITAKHQSKQESSSALLASNGNSWKSSKTPERQASEPKIQPILRLSTAPKQPSPQKQQEEDLRRKEIEQQEQRRELEELERQRQFEEHERQVQFEEQERQRQLEEHERQMHFEEQERQRHLEEQERRQRELEEQNREKQLQEEQYRRKQEEENRLQEERQRQQEMERQKQQELERQRQQELERKKEQEQRQRESERKKQEESRQRQLEEEKQRQFEAQRQQELENQRLREEQEWQRHRQQEEERIRIEQQERQRQQLYQQPDNQNRLKRQGSVPIQVRQASFKSDTNQQQQNQVESQTNHQVRATSASRSPNVSPTSGLIKAPLPWMSAIPRRETSAPPEFVNYAQNAQSRLQHQRSQRQQSFEQGKVPQAPSPVLKEAMVVSPPVVFQHPGQNDFGRSTLPRNTKLNSGPAQRPWVAKHQQYQQQQQQQTSEQQHAQRPSYQQPGPGQKWPGVKQPSYLRQQSSSNDSNQRTITSGGAKVRIIPIMVEQDSSSDQEQPYFPSTANNSTIRSVPINSSYGPSYQPPAPGGNASIPASPRTPQTPPSRAPLSSGTPPSQRWTQQPSFTAPQQQQPQQQRVPIQQQQPLPTQQQNPQKVNYNNPIGLYSDGNAMEALQQMQQSLAQLNTGLQNAYPKFIQETISNSLPTRSVSSPGPGGVAAPDPNAAPMQSRSFRILQNVVDSEASGSEDELRGYLPQDYPEAYQTAQVKTFAGGAPSPRGGINRSTSNTYAPSPLAQQVPQSVQSFAKYRDDGEPRGSSSPRASKCFRRLQTITDTLPEGAEPQGPVHIGKVNTQQPQPRLQQGGSNSAAIPSRAFRALQQHTYGGQQEDAEVPSRTSASPPHPMSTSPSPSFPSSSSSQSHASSTDRAGDRYSGTTSGNTFRSVAPHIVVTDGPVKHRNVVNSALTKQREASPSRHWHVNTTSSSRSESPSNLNSLSDDQSRLLKFISKEAADSANRSDIGVAEPKKLYGGAKIPSRVFKQLQTEFSDSSDVPDSKSPTLYDASPSNDGGDKPQLSAGLLRLLQSDFNKLQNDRSPSNIENCVLSSSYENENDETYKNGIVNTAATKEHVLKELTTQFDPVTQRRKPRAAPGRVFRYLQQQYDEPEDLEGRPVQSNNNYSNINKFTNGRSNSLATSTIGQQSSFLNGSGRSSPRHNSIPNEMTSHESNSQPRFQSPSFAYLQSQYHQEEGARDTINGNEGVNGTSRTSSRNDSSADDVDNHDLNSLRISEEGDPVLSKPYVGNRIPGRTFRMLQENYASHPSVLQARK